MLALQGENIVFTNLSSGSLKYRRKLSQVFLKHIWTKHKRKYTKCDRKNPERFWTFELIPNVGTNSTASVGHQEFHCFEKKTIRNYWMGGQGVFVKGSFVKGS